MDNRLNGKNLSATLRRCKLNKQDKSRFERLYLRLNRREFVHPDPLEFLYGYRDPLDREIVGLVASALAYGKVASILKNVSFLLKILGPAPSVFLLDHSHKSLRHVLKGFVHRFADSEKTAAFLVGAREAVAEYGSLGECFMYGQNKNDETIFSGLCFFAETIGKFCPACPGHLVPMPRKKSACKRFNLYFRWMVRRDDVDPGGWDERLRPKLIVPLDAHMHRIGLALGFTERKTADMKTAMEVTVAFRKIRSDDPVRYDFALTRLGIRSDMGFESFLDG